jgi:hypothetical protein
MPSAIGLRPRTIAPERLAPMRDSFTANGVQCRICVAFCQVAAIESADAAGVQFR